MIRNKCVVYLAFVLFLLSACQATPEDQIVINKGENNLEEMILVDQENDPFKDIPKVLSKSIASDDSKIIVNIDAEVVLPDIENIPVGKMVPRSITQTEIDQIVNSLMQNKELYEPRDLQDFSKEEIMEEILELKSGKNSDLYQENPDQYQEEIKDRLEMLEKLYMNAPDEIVKKPVSTKLQASDRDEKAIVLSVNADLGKANPATFTYFDKQTKIVSFSFTNTVGIPPMGQVTENFDVPGITISLEEAKQMAEDTVHKLEMGSFSINGMGTIPNIGVFEDIVSYNDLPKCYVFYFTREFNGLRETYVNPSYIRNLKSPTEQYNYVWPCEAIEVMVDDSGIICVLYTGPMADVEIINKNSSIKSFNDVIAAFEKQSYFLSAYQDEKDIIKTTININKIVLGATKVIGKNATEYLLVPSWDFFGSITNTYKEGTGDKAQLNENNEFIENNYAMSIMTINAIDGSVIDRSLGY